VRTLALLLKQVCIHAHAQTRTRPPRPPMPASSDCPAAPLGTEEGDVWTEGACAVGRGLGGPAAAPAQTGFAVGQSFKQRRAKKSQWDLHRRRHKNEGVERFLTASSARTNRAEAAWPVSPGSVPNACSDHRALLPHLHLAKANTAQIFSLYTQTERLQKMGFPTEELLLAPGFCVHLSK